tara:strand:+ start:172 stop:312 length:141 start_codon:yes stop_codon:yes gene_type:complete
LDTLSDNEVNDLTEKYADTEGRRVSVFGSSRPEAAPQLARVANDLY